MTLYSWLSRCIIMSLFLFIIFNVNAQDGPELINLNSSFEDGFIGWEQYIDAAAGANFDISKDAIEGKECAHAKVTKISGTNWHVGLTQDGLTLRAGQYHTVDFFAKADVKRIISIELKRSPGLGDWEGITDLDLTITEEWDEYSHNFTPGKDYKQAALFAFWLGQEKGDVWVDGVRIYEGKKQERKELTLPKSVMADGKLVTVWAMIKTSN